MSERLVITIEYDVIGDMQPALADATTQIQAGRDRLDPGLITMIQGHIAIKDMADKVLALFDATV